MIDVNAYYAKLAKKESLSEDEVLGLLQELQHFRGSTAYLASCQAATLESLPKSAGKSSRARHVTLCDAAAKLLDGDPSPFRYPTDAEWAKKRCLTAAENHK